ncbi:MAG TPA: site-2 protease family protein [Candidatus Paceibacterota bacterium]|nr:site-2 protease family protein [Candidatus Paceibacterota bacterium]
MTGINAIFYIIVLIMSVVIHEVAHGYSAYLLGDKTAYFKGRLTLNPLKHLDPFGSVILPLILILTNSGFVIGWAKPVPYNPII